VAIDLLAQSGETLAGRISYPELDPFGISELGREALDRFGRASARSPSSVRGSPPTPCAVSRGLGVSAPSVATYLDLLVDLLLVLIALSPERVEPSFYRTSARRRDRPHPALSRWT
jgi:hypothetical protein